MAEVLRCGVAGAGVFGGYHADQYAQAEGCRLTAVYDSHADRAAAAAQARGGEVAAFAELAAFLDAVDLVSVTAPASSHFALSAAALRAGKHVYVEKPIATSIEDAEILAGLAAKGDLVLVAGHQERMVFKAMGLLDVPEAPLSLQAVRRGLFSPRNRDVSCVLDLMIHDIDLALALDPSDPFAVEARGRRAEGPGLDEVFAEASFESGLTCHFEASRSAAVRDRRMVVRFPSGLVEIDFLSRSFRNTTPFALDPGFAETPVGRDPLRAALGAFIRAVRGEADPALSTPQTAVRALDLSLAVEQAAEAADDHGPSEGRV
jgi:predicted dehydrogenase